MYDNTKNDYSAIKHNTGTAPRCLNRVSDYYALHEYKTEAQDAKEFFSGALFVLSIVSIIAYVVYSIYQC